MTPADACRTDPTILVPQQDGEVLASREFPDGCEILIQEFATEKLRIYPPDIFFVEALAFDSIEVERRFHPLFRNVVFQAPVILEDKAFPSGISFVNCVFKQAVSFKRSVFDGPAYFWNCRFELSFNFFHVVVKVNRVAIQLREPGEVNFSYCWFENEAAQSIESHFKQPSLDRALFEGPAFFHRTAFLNGVSAEECRFKGGARFEDFETDICVHKDKIPSSVFETVAQKTPRVLFPNTDHDDHLDFDWNIRSERSLNRALIRSLPEEYRTAHDRSLSSIAPNTGAYRLKRMVGRTVARVRKVREERPEDRVPGRDFESVRVLWRTRRAAKMFGGPNAAKETLTLSSFRGAHFGPTSHFSYVDLSNCRFQGANLEDIDFQVVRWVRQPCGLFVRRIVGLFIDIAQKHPGIPLVSWRSALRDELEIDGRISQYGNADGQFTSRRIELSELYRELRIAYDREGDGQGARDFYFGELEAQRLSSNRLVRWFGMLHLYKVFSGYSKREGLAFAWLLIYI